ncbi:MAG TPA: ABC transporter substrate-binding protein [Candidatus Onthenecus intestinigallinarum]|uniref:ABC transporter substrate-binding protein n=1 Tax=Candidatus Onthenecus intestinigallinarum TaxID=2840875 RepID=A0A9D0Z8K7_9FIRM|nr:ABC transporter substrate-binding protein [Candidatus Onthenecus intestinigallinarum]
MRKTLALLLTALMLLSAGCAQAASLMDMYGREVVLDASATRIVALAPSDCEILCALGAEDLLVGRGAYCDYPESILDVPVVETGENTNLEQIIALQPQVVLMADMAQTAEQVQALEDAGIRVVLSDANDIEGVYTAIRMIGQLTGLEGEAEALVADMQATFDGIVAQSEETGKTVYFEVSPLEYGLWTAGANTFMDELASLCGLTNAFADVEGWAAISEEQVLERDPDYIVTISMYYGEGPTPVEEIMGRPGWEHLKAVENGDVFNADSNEISRPGPRLKDAALALYAFVSGEAEEPAA